MKYPKYSQTLRYWMQITAFIWSNQQIIHRSDCYYFNRQIKLKKNGDKEWRQQLYRCQWIPDVREETKESVDRLRNYIEENWRRKYTVRSIQTDGNEPTHAEWNNKQDGRLAPAYFLQEYKYFDQHICPQLKTRLLFKIWFAKVFYKHQFHHWFLYSMQKRGVSRLFVQNFLSQYRKISLGNSSVNQKFSGSEKFYA